MNNAHLLAGQRMTPERRQFVDNWVAEELKKAPFAVSTLEASAAAVHVAPSELVVALNAAGAYRQDGTIYRKDT